MKKIQERIGRLSHPNSAGLPYADTKRELIKLLTIVDWFLEKTKDEYLGRSESSVLKSLRTDKPPREFMEVLLEEEKAEKKAGRAENKKLLELLKSNPELLAQLQG